MYSPKLKTYQSHREKIVSNIVRNIDNNSDLNTEVYKNRILKQLKKGRLF